MIFFGGLFMIFLSCAVWVIFIDPLNSSENKHEVKYGWLVDCCFATFMMGLGIIIIGVFFLIERWLT